MEQANSVVKPSSVKKEVQQFYDTIGWLKKGQTLFEDAYRFEDLRAVTGDYIRKCHLRVKRYLKQSGRYLLDVGSGPIQFSEYLEYSRGYEFRVCLDLSMAALVEARKRLQDKGLYILGDATNLPFRDNTFEGIVSLHTLYHVPADEQKTAFLEIHRVLEPTGSAVIVYSWGNHSGLMLIPVLIPHKIRALFKKIAKSTSLATHQGPRLYFHPHTYHWIRRNLMKGMDLEILVWRSVSVPFLQQYIADNHLGRRVLELVYRVEEKWPRWAGRWGQYPLILIHK